MPDPKATSEVKPFPRRDPPPTRRQIYALARELIDESGRDWPETRSEASELIGRLREKNSS